MQELINKCTNDYVTVLPCENGANVNNKGYFCKRWKYYVHILMCMHEASWYLKLNLATLCWKEIGSFDASKEL